VDGALVEWSAGGGVLPESQPVNARQATNPNKAIRVYILFICWVTLYTFLTFDKWKLVRGQSSLLTVRTDPLLSIVRTDPNGA